MLQLHLTNITIYHVFGEEVVDKKRAQCIFILSVQGNPNQRRQLFRAILHKASSQEGGSKVLDCSDFNGMDQFWDYVKSNAKGRSL
ncbi:hypothetical protein HPB48_010083 [Haemaphysalis longicornis]|uniref:Uncharacterized protein n=1 Tax=Haemaphysalis longicornis TaxID=44386 RepID=A0A9J6GD75_HAELO|nr:hypothetical protein HPB48_010083 [Haemaphysalis longicornis]